MAADCLAAHSLRPASPFKGAFFSSSDGFGTTCSYGVVSASAVNMLVMARAAARYRVRCGIRKISWMVRSRLTWL